jgi:hypothetical protein
VKKKHETCEKKLEKELIKVDLNSHNKTNQFNQDQVSTLFLLPSLMVYAEYVAILTWNHKVENKK